MGAMVLILLFTIILSFGCAQLSKTYERGPIALSPVAALSWSVDFIAREISFALQISDAALRNTTAGDSWVGLGVGESTSGGMLGADIFTAEFSTPSVDGECIVKDRHVPFVAYPLTQEPGAYPVEDTCQTDASWALVSCRRDIKGGTMVFEVRRPLNATTSQDRKIGTGEQAVMYAYGGSVFKYHSPKNRGTARVMLYNDDDTLPAKKNSNSNSAENEPLPADVVANFTMLASNYSVPNGTTYACTAATLPLRLPGNSNSNSRRYMVAAEHVLNSVSGANSVHHFVVQACPRNNVTESFAGNTSVCTGDLGRVRATCTIIFAWAVGIGRVVLPDGVGMLISGENNMIVMESHFDNTRNATGVVDNSGVRLYLSKNRGIEAGTLALGDTGISMFGETVKNDHNYTMTCPSNCTAKWPSPYINVFSSFLHMHTTGRLMWTNRYNADSSFNETTNSIRFWSNEHQLVRTFNPPKRIGRGDMLTTTCNYDTSKRPATKFGIETADEMCIDFLFYYPAQRLNRNASGNFYCGLMYDWDNKNKSRVKYPGTFCGHQNDPNAFSYQRNPSFNDTHGIAGGFGNAPQTCARAEAGAQNGSANVPGAVDANKTAAVCFPGSTTVETRARGVVAIRDLAVGDEVSVGHGKFSTVFMFTHRIPGITFVFVQLTTVSGEVLRLTGGHMLYKASGGRGVRLVPARSVRPGDALMGADGARKVVSEISSVDDVGLYNPQTMHGDIAVGGVVASTYTEAVSYRKAHALLAPLRSVKEVLGWSTRMLEDDEWSAARCARGALKQRTI